MPTQFTKDTPKRVIQGILFVAEVLVLIREFTQTFKQASISLPLLLWGSLVKVSFTPDIVATCHWLVPQRYQGGNVRPKLAAMYHAKDIFI